jgi:hypothetical protein
MVQPSTFRARVIARAGNDATPVVALAGLVFSPPARPPATVRRANGSRPTVGASEAIQYFYSAPKPIWPSATASVPRSLQQALRSIPPPGRRRPTSFGKAAWLGRDIRRRRRANRLAIGHRCRPTSSQLPTTVAPLSCSPARWTGSPRGCCSFMAFGSSCWPTWPEPVS